MLTYKELKKEPSRFLALPSLTVTAFDERLPLFQTTWEADVEKRAQAKPRQRKWGGGRKPTLGSPEDMLLFILVYFKIYPVQEVQGILFGMSQGQANVWIKRLTPILQTILKQEAQLPERKPANLEQVLAEYDLPESTIDNQTSSVKRVLRKEKPMSQQLIDAITEIREVDALKITEELLTKGTNPLDILEACRQAMEVIGQQFEAGESFVPELILAGEVLKQISEKVKPLLQEQAEPSEKLGKIVFGTVEGDIHDIAKDIVAFMLDINGFEVLDLGVDVPPAKFVEKTQETGAKIVGLSGFLTLAYDPMKDTVEALKAAGLNDVKVMIGGGQIDEQIREYTGADAYGRDAMAAVSLAKAWAGVA